MRSEFLEILQTKSKELYRQMPWRDDTRAYYVLVSELMLQQTQVARVIPKFKSFIAAFPDEHTLARASLADVLKQWQGLGYNRRAKYLQEAAKQIVTLGTFPEDEAGLLALPGVGKNTAGAIRAYSFDQPSIFIETNIRTVYIHHFFKDNDGVDDKSIIEKLIATAPWESTNEQPGTPQITSFGPREFYWALMDYGSWLKANGVKNLSQSKSYTRQPPLKGSIREVRGMILRELSTDELSYKALQNLMPKDPRFEKALSSLISEKLVSVSDKIIHLTK
jgi:A/G-specific adenine glycosylase